MYDKNRVLIDRYENSRVLRNYRLGKEENKSNDHEHVFHKKRPVSKYMSTRVKMKYVPRILDNLQYLTRLSSKPS